MLGRFESSMVSFFQREKLLLRVESESGSAERMNGPNSHIYEFLEYFLSLEFSPYYAVLVSGVWGIGKTYLVKDILKSKLPVESISYVSLYGLDSVDAIDTALYQSLHPVLTNKGVKIAGRVGKAALKFVKMDGVLRVGDLPALGKNRLYVFDDLERASMNIDVVLGYINEMVEHDGCKVLIIGNEEKLIGKPGYKETKEKLVGRVLEVQPEVEKAFNHFVSQLNSTGAKGILTNHASAVALIFKEASATNFRVLQQTIWDFERIIECLELRHIQDESGMKALLGTFFAVSLETKAGILTQQDLLSRPDGLMRAMLRQGDRQVPPPLDLADSRFSEADLYDSIANNTVLCDLLFKGMANAGSWRESLDRSSYYVNVDTEPAWRTVWNGSERDEQDFDHALREMERQFCARELFEPGEILHVVGMRLWLADIGVLPLTRADTLDQAKKYLMDLYARGQLTPQSRDIYRDEFHGYGGLGIHQVESEEYRNFVELFNAQRSQVTKDLYPQKAAKLLLDMETDVGLFLRQICRNNEADNTYAYEPILVVIDPSEFVRRVMGLSAAHRRKAIMALNIRYSHGSIDRELTSEKEWLVDVHRLFCEAAQALSAMARWSVLNAVQHYIEPLTAPAALQQAKEC